VGCAPAWYCDFERRTRGSPATWAPHPGQGTAASAGFSIVGIILSLISAIIGWLIGGWLTAFVATTFFQGKTNTGEMLRVLGYTRIFSILGVIPIIGGLVGAILGIIGNVIGIREAAEFDTTKAILTAVIVFVIVLIITAVIFGAIFAIVLGAAAVRGGS